MEQRQSRALLTFISALNVNLNGVVVWNKLDDELPQLSDFFTPNFEVSELAVRFKKVLELGETFEPTSSIKLRDSLEVFTKSSFKYTNRHIYVLVQMIFLESIALLYAIENDTALRKYINKEDPLRIHENINYVIENLSGMRQHSQLIKELRLIDVDVMYLMSRLGGEYGAVR